MISDRKAFRHEIRALLDAELVTLRAEITRDMGELQSKIARKRNQLQTIKAEMKRRKEGLPEGELLVSDHAIVRYLERHKNFDIEEIRQEIRTIAKQALPIKDSDRMRNGDIVFAIRERADRTICTIMNDTESEIVHKE